MYATRFFGRGTEMGQLEETVRVIVELRAAMARFRENLEGNEVQTRASLIDPMLRVLGWNVGDPAEVALETGRGVGVADYVLKDRNTGLPLVMVEAKSLNSDLGTARGQVSNYCYAEGVEAAIVTDGDDWVLLNVDVGTFADEVDDEYYDEDDEYEDDDGIPPLEVAQFSISRGDAVISAINAQLFANPKTQVADWKSEVAAALARASESEVEVSVGQSPRNDRQTLASLRELNNPPIPARLYFPDGYVMPLLVSSASELVRNVAIYLGFIYVALDEVELPIWAYRSRTKYVANDRPRHDNRRDFGLEYEVGDGVYVELDHTPRSGVNAACSLLDECGVDSHSVVVTFDNNP